MMSTRTPQTKAPAVKPAEKAENRSPDFSSADQFVSHERMVWKEDEV